jgi:hypothetical protein
LAGGFFSSVRTRNFRLRVASRFSQDPPAVNGLVADHDALQLIDYVHCTRPPTWRVYLGEIVDSPRREAMRCMHGAYDGRAHAAIVGPTHMF